MQRPFAHVAGLGVLVPAQVVHNRDFEARLETSDQWIVERTGIRERRFAGVDETVATMSKSAACAALGRAGISAQDLDTVLVASAEYRLHVPQAFGYDPNPGELFGQPFKFKPQQPYGRADWDLIVKGFVDGGKTINSHKQSFERDETLLGAGFGFEAL